MELMESRRKEKRVPFGEMVFVNGALRVKAIDISEGGLYLHTGRSFIPGSIVEVSFPLNYEVISAPAKVRFNQEGVGMGLEFVKLPRAAREKIRAFVEKVSCGLDAGSTKKKIVAIYDDKSELRLHRSALVCEGFSFVEIKMGPGINRSLEEQLPVDLIMLALEMNSEPDFTLLSILGKSEDFGGIPVLVISGNTRPDTAHRVMSLGAVEFLSRMTASPKKIAEIVNKVRSKGLL